MPGLSLRQIDRKTGIEGFGQALCDVGWLADHPQGVRIVRFEEHNGTSAKRRCTDAQRKATVRDVSASDADKLRTDCGQKTPNLGARVREEKEKEKKEDKRASAPPPPESVDPQTWADWLQLRRAKKAPVTATVIASATAEAQKAGMTLDAFLRVWCARGSHGLQADWLKPHERPAFSAVPSGSAVPSVEQTRAAQAAEREAPPADRAKARAALDMALGAIKRVA